MFDGNIFFLLKHFAVTAVTAALFCFFGWWLRGRFGAGAPAGSTVEDRERWKQMRDKLEAAQQQAKQADQYAAELNAEFKKTLSATVPRSDLIAAQNALADERSHSADLHERLQRALQAATAKQEPPDEATRIFGRRVPLDDLKIVEGIGPKIEMLLKADGIRTWAELADATPDRIRAILQAAGPRYVRHDPATWPEQSRLAHEKKWEELKQSQDKLVRGRTVA